MYRAAFFGLDAGRAAATAAVMLALNLAIAAIAVRLVIRRRTA